MLSGNNYSGELAYVLLMFGNFQWNVSRGIENAGDNDYGTRQLWRIEGINSLAQQLGIHPLPHPAFKLKLLDHTNELFLTKYAAPWADIHAAKAEVVSSVAANDDNTGNVLPASGEDRCPSSNLPETVQIFDVDANTNWLTVFKVSMYTCIVTMPSLWPWHAFS
jgi:hypothetical protein